MARVAAGRREAPAVGAERQAVDKAGVAAQRDRLSRLGRFRSQTFNVESQLPDARYRPSGLKATFQT